MKKILTLSFLVLVNFSFVLSQVNIKEVTILHWNDFHARNTQQKLTRKDSVSGSDITVYYGGTANMLGYVKNLRKDNTLVLNAGDDYQGSPISTITRGWSQIKLLNLYNLDAFVLGNHEFDYGQYALDSALQTANFDYLCANIYFNPKQNTIGKPYVIKEKGGVKFGILGISVPDLMELSLPKNVDQLVMLNTDSVITSGIAELKKQNCDVIVLLTHVGVNSDKELAAKYFKDVDVIVGGHSHTPLYKPINKNGVIIVQAGSYSRWLGELDLKVDTDKDTIISYQGKLIQTDESPEITDNDAKNFVDNMIKDIQPMLMRVIGTLETDWKQSYSDESNLAQWNADAFRQATGSDIGFMNSGGCRKSLSKGDITVNDMWEISPFGNTLVTFTVKGSTLKQMLKGYVKNMMESIQKNDRIDMINTAGLSYTYDSKKALEGAEDYILNITVNGSPLDENANYKIVSNNYVSSQFNKFFGEVTEKIEFLDTQLIDRDVLIEAVEKQKVINSVLQHNIVDVSE
jgi:2',3'-cyclic-nucleotide 2'-phosphodiesterase (5'-nucleotidase family)